MKRTLFALFVVLFAYSLYSFFDAVGQYGTADENTTWNRTMYFLRHGVVEDVTTEGHVALVFVGPIGGALKYLLSLRYQYGDTIVPGIQFNPYVAYNFVSVLWCLALLLGCVYLWSRYVGWHWKTHAVELASVTLLLLNFPLLKAVIKTLRYDSLSLLLSTAGILFYLLYRKENQRKFFYAGIWCLSWAFYEKGSTLPMLALVSLVELLQTAPWKIKCKTFAQIVGIFFISGYVLITKAWLNPLLAVEPLRFAAEVAGVSLFQVVAFALSGLLALILLQKPLAWAKDRFPQVAFLKTLHLVFLISTLFAVVFQANQIYSGNYLPDALRERVSNENLFLSPAVFGNISTTLDTSSFVTRAKLFVSHLRLAAYSLPEPILLCLLLFPFLLYRRYLPFTEGTSFFFLNAFFLFALFTLIFFPVESKYDLNAFIFLTFAAVSLFAGWAETVSGPKRTGVAVLLAVFSMLPIRAYAPTHFAYHNLLRNPGVEKNEYTQVKFTPWTWSGWGESSYYLFRQLERQNESGVVLVDYHIPHSQFRNLTARHFRYPDFATREAMFRWLEELSQTDAKYLLVSRVQSFRLTAPNLLVNALRNKAIAVDARGGTEYGWVFRLSDFSPTNRVALAR